MSKIYDQKINKHQDWGGDASTGNLPVSGERVQEFIKELFEARFGCLHYDEINGRYLCFADSENRDLYISDPVLYAGLLLSTFLAPSEYKGSISLISGSYNPVLAGTKNVYLEFTFDIVNSQGVSTGEGVTCIYTITNGNNKKVVNDKYKGGLQVKFLLDEFLMDGLNRINIQIIGENTLTSTSTSCQFEVVALILNDTYDISTLNTPNGTISIPYFVLGSGTKFMEWYLDGVLLPQDPNDIIYQTETNRVKNIDLPNLNHGAHTLLFRAYVLVGQDKFYSKTILKSFIVKDSITLDPVIGFNCELPIGDLVGADGVVLINKVRQYDTYRIKYTAYNPLNLIMVSTIKDGETLLATNNISNGEVLDIEYKPLKEGANKLTITINTNYKQEINFNIDKSDLDIQEITSGLALDLSPIGKNNTDELRDKWVYKDITTTFRNFEWTQASGWTGNSLLIKEGTGILVEYQPFKNDIKNVGYTFEVEFKTYNNSVFDERILSIDNGQLGLYITGEKIEMRSRDGKAVHSFFKYDERIRIAFVIHKLVGDDFRRMMFIYLNGQMIAMNEYIASDSFINDSKLAIDCLPGCNFELFQLRAYSRSLTHDEVLNNFIFYRPTIDEMLTVYDKNDIYEQGTLNISIDKLAARTPVLLFTGDVKALLETKDKNKTIYLDEIDYIDRKNPDLEFHGTGTRLRPQGTSSMQYPIKNFRFYLEYGEHFNNKGEKIEATKIKSNSIPVSTFCMKADYAESSGTHNTGIARLWNDYYYNVKVNDQYVCRTQALKAALANNYNYDVRTAIDGYPIVILYRDNVDSPYIFLGHYNFNNDKSTENVFGFCDIPGFDNTNMACWEHLNNTHPIGLFTDVSNFDLEWDKAFEARYPEDFQMHHLQGLKDFAIWVNETKTNPAKFAAEYKQHLDMDKMAAYYVYLMRFGGVDLVVKNAMLTTEDGQHFYYIHYDNDTVLGLRNDGLMIFKPDIDRQSIDPSSSTGEYCYAGHDSVLWNNLEVCDEFMARVKVIDNGLYQAGMRYDKVLDLLDNKQMNAWSSKVYNNDHIVKYIQPFQDQGINNLYMAQGSRQQHRRWWLSNRFALYDAMYVSGEYKSSVIDIKAGGTPVGSKFEITSGKKAYYGFGINNDVIESGVELDIDQVYDFTTPRQLAIGDPLRIYSAHTIKKLNLKVLSNYLTTFNVASAYNEVMGTQLLDIDISSTTNNTALAEISGLKSIIKLKNINVAGQHGLTTLDLSGNNSIEVINAANTNIKSVSIAKGSPLREFRAARLNSLHLEELSTFTVEQLFVDYISDIKDVVVNKCPNFKSDIFIFNKWLPVASTTELLTTKAHGIYWTITCDQLISFVDKMTSYDLAGTIELTQVSEELINWILQTFGFDCLNPLATLYIKLPLALQNIIYGPDVVKVNSQYRYQAIIEDAKTPIVYDLDGSIGGEIPGFCKINKTNGNLVTYDYYSDNNITIIAYPQGEPNRFISKSALMQTYTFPTAGSISGDDSLSTAFKDYTLSITQQYDAPIKYKWEITSGADKVDIQGDISTASILLKSKAILTTLGNITVRCTVYKLNDVLLFSVSKTLSLPFSRESILTVSNGSKIGDLLNCRAYNNLDVFDVVKNGNIFTVTYNGASSPLVEIYGEYIASDPVNIVSITGPVLSVSAILKPMVELTLTGEENTPTDGVPYEYYNDYEAGKPVTTGVYSSMNKPIIKTTLDRAKFIITTKGDKFYSATVEKTIDTVSSTIHSQNMDLERIIAPTIFTTKSTTTGVRFESVKTGATIDWGDGSQSRILNTGATWNDHTYTDGLPEHIVTITGSYVIYFYNNNVGTSTSHYAFKNIYKLVQLTGSNTKYNSSFCGSGLVEIDSLALKYSNITSAIGLFYNCSPLTTIPQGLFDNNVNITSFSSCFDYCRSLTSIPTGLFDNNVNVTSFSTCFYECSSLTSIPLGLFDNNVNVTTVYYCFSYCSKLTTIPQGLFNNNVNVTDFSYCFYDCRSLTTIPQGLFDNNTKVTSFNCCFYNCSSLTSIPTGLFDNNVNVIDFSYCFYRCNSLTSIPTGLFDNNVRVTSLRNCFSYCSSLNHPYNLTSPGKKKLWERNSDGDGVEVTSYSNFASNASTIFKSSIPITWGGSLCTVPIKTINKATQVAMMGTEVTINEVTKLTDNNGLCSFDLIAGDYTVSFKHSSINNIPDQQITVSNNDLKVFQLEEFVPPTIFTTKSTTVGVRFSLVKPGTIVDWGDGSTSENLSTGSTWNNHTYTDGVTEHTITIDGSYELYHSASGYNNSYAAFNNIYKLILITGSNISYSSIFTNSGLVEVGMNAFKYSNVTDFNYCFYNCGSLRILPENLFADCPNATSFSYTFYGCSSLSILPSGLFSNCSKANSFYYCFKSCRSLTTLPSNLFSSCINVDDFLNCFDGCESLEIIPSSLFNNNVKAASFSSCFSNCSLLTTIPSGLFDNNVKVTSFSYCFSGCSSLTSITQGLFDKNVNATDFLYCFRNCSSLTSIPLGLFDNNVNVTRFSYCFINCSSLNSVPQGLFDNNVNATDFNNCFYNCTSLTTIPSGLFNNNVNVTTFSNCFYNCTSLTTIPAGLFDKNVNATDFLYCFRNCSSLTSITLGLFDNNVNVTDFSNCFNGCSSLTTIPTGLFDNNVKVTSFSSCFSNCSLLTTIPSGLFDNNVNVTNFSYCFYYCKLTSIPQGLFDKNVNVTNFSYCFYDCKLTSIPQGLFDKNVNVASFEYTFGGCSLILSIPEGLFDFNVKATNFKQCFNGASSINHAYNCTSSGKKKLWERDGDADGVRVTTYSNFAYAASIIFKETVPISWGGSMQTPTMMSITVDDYNSIMSRLSALESK